MEYIEKLTKKAQRHRSEYYKKFHKEVMEDLEAMAENGEYDVHINVSQYPADILAMLGEELHKEGFKYSLNSDEKEVTLYVSIRHMVAK